MRRLNNKVCLITGGAGGIGFAAVERFLAEGAKVVFADVNEALGREKLGLLTAGNLGSRVQFCVCDVSDEVQVQRMVGYAVEVFGRIDAIFNNAGIGGAFGPLMDIRVCDWDQTLAIVLRGTFLCIKHAARAMMLQETGGSIVNNASVVAHVGDSAGAAYSAAKAGIVSLTYSAAAELAEHRIRVTAISPGTILTPLLHRGRDMSDLREAAIEHQPWPEAEVGESVAATAAFLASDEARCLTGEEIAVDGGASAAGPAYSNSTGTMRELLWPYIETASHDSPLP